MKKRNLVFAFAFLLIGFFEVACSNTGDRKKNITVVFYNVENLFDLEDDPSKNDNEFLPESEKKWNEERYLKKLDDISNVLSSVNPADLPEIIGLCEVENRTVLEDLVATKNLSKGEYEIVHFESPDFRGIDCALLFRPAEFKVIESRPFLLQLPNENSETRDILYVKGKTGNREIFHVFVNHWPSRVEGLEKSEPNRLAAATLLKTKTDSILNADGNAKIIVLGDMNDEPSNKSLNEILSAKTPSDKNSKLVNLMFPAHLQKLGSYNYRGNWNMLDNIVVSKAFTSGKGFQCKEPEGKIFREPWMEYKNQSGEISPNRTYGGPNYYGGVSDHFPVYFQLVR